MADKHGRHPLGRRCGDPAMLLTALLLMPYAMVRCAIDWMAGR
jgi:hypothetical protein